MIKMRRNIELSFDNINEVYLNDRLWSQIGVGVDGSEQSELCYTLVYKDLMKESDSLIILHISNKWKKYLPYNFCPDYINDRY